jgi:mRNA-degrading endonuclease YafQ of YafQ-DinJ toxin-antitoxin module
MIGNVSRKELIAALDINDELRNKISKYEQDNWAANISSPAMQVSWKTFLKSLERNIADNTLDDNTLIELIHFLSTTDSVELLDKIGELDPSRQSRFLELLNWVSEKSPSQQQKENACHVKERILMIYRMQQYPKIYSPARMARAAHIVKSSV